MARQHRSILGVVVGFFLLLVVALIGGYLYFQSLLGPVSSETKITAIFVVKKGQGIDVISSNLEDAHLIRSAFAFKWWARIFGTGKKIQAGTFRLSASMSASEVMQELTHGTLDLWVKVKEASRREEIAATIKAAYAEQNIVFDDQAFLKATATKEGYLFPDTYLLPLDATPENVASIMENTFDKKITDDMTAAIQKSGHSLKDVVTMASLIEREARTAEDRKIVSSILWKRIGADWPLQVDATLQYANGYSRKMQTWWQPPTAADKAVKSPYNTYTNPGLPPTPICAPSEDSLIAAVYPKDSPYWFYLSDNQTGAMHFAKDLEEHNKNIETYLK